MKKPEGAALARLCRKYADDKKALQPVILDLRKLESPSEFFLICSAESEPQLKAIANHIEQSLKEKHCVKAWSIHGTSASRWIVMDYSSVLVHIFHQEKRVYYQIEDLWSAARQIS
ncbi:MAG: ribosome silencing factor [Verrucomicrobiota bacterium]